MSVVFDSLSRHRSVRKYKDSEVKKEDLDMILSAAQYAPSSINGQQWSIVVIKDKEKKKKLAELTGGQEWIDLAPVFLVFVADYNRASIAAAKQDKDLIITESVESVMVACVDVGLAMQNSINAAESLGYGIVPIGAVRKEPEEVIDLLGLPKYVFPVAGLCIGVPDEEQSQKPRLPQGAVVHYESYNNDLERYIDSYDETIKQYMKKRTQNASSRTWSEGIMKSYNRVYYPKVYQALKNQGFENNK